GNGFAITSFACWLPVPGNDRLLLVLSPVWCETTTSATATTNQTPRTTNRWRTENRPSAYRTLVIARALFSRIARHHGPSTTGVCQPRFEAPRVRRGAVRAFALQCCSRVVASVTSTGVEVDAND